MKVSGEEGGFLTQNVLVKGYRLYMRKTRKKKGEPLRKSARGKTSGLVRGMEIVLRGGESKGQKPPWQKRGGPICKLKRPDGMPTVRVGREGRRAGGRKRGCKLDRFKKALITRGKPGRGDEGRKRRTFLRGRRDGRSRGMFDKVQECRQGDRRRPEEQKDRGGYWAGNRRKVKNETSARRSLGKGKGEGNQTKPEGPRTWEEGVQSVGAEGRSGQPFLNNCCDQAEGGGSRVGWDTKERDSGGTEKGKRKKKRDKGRGGEKELWRRGGGGGGGKKKTQIENTEE